MLLIWIENRELRSTWKWIAKIAEAATEFDEKMKGIFSIAFDFSIVAVIIHHLP